LVEKTEQALQAAQKAGRNRVIHADLIKEMTNQSYIII
jgi:glycerol-3-phosphate responsive antiterminator